MTSAREVAEKIGLRRRLSQYAGVSPDAIADGSRAQMKFFVEDAKHDIAVLADALATAIRSRSDTRPVEEGEA